MLVVDSSVWIDYFNNRPEPAVDLLEGLLNRGEIRIVVPDIVLFDVLRGFRHERDYRQAKQLLQALSVVDSVNPALCLEAAQHFRALRAKGLTVRGPLDVLLASFCIEHDYALLRRDRDFDAFEDLRGLRVWRH